MLCCDGCTRPNDIRSLTGGAAVRPIFGYGSPKKDASATALGGSLEFSVKILTSV